MKKVLIGAGIAAFAIVAYSQYCKAQREKSGGCGCGCDGDCKDDKKEAGEKDPASEKSTLGKLAEVPASIKSDFTDAVDYTYSKAKCLLRIEDCSATKA